MSPNVAGSGTAVDANVAEYDCEMLPPFDSAPKMSVIVPGTRCAVKIAVVGLVPVVASPVCATPLRTSVIATVFTDT